MYDLIVIGAGPGGYIAAIRAAQLGMNVACVEKDKTLGGTCLNVGCIPSKALLESSELYAQAMHRFADHGLKVESVEVDLAKMLARKDRIVKSLVGGVEFLFKKNKITWLKGHGRIVSATEVEVVGKDGDVTKHACKRVLIATGSAPASLKGVDLDGDVIGTSTEAIAYPEVPKHLAIIGAGVIGLELGSVWARLGSRVTVVEYMPQILPGNDADIVAVAQKTFMEQGMDFVLSAKVMAAATKTVAKKKVGELTFEKDGKTQTIVADRILVCVGRRPYTDGLGLDKAGVQTNPRGFIPVNEHFETNVKGIFAIGDVIPGLMLAHKAEEEGVAAVEYMTSGHGHVTYEAIPGIVYTHPEIASVGKTEEQLKKDGVEYKVGKFNFMPNGRAKALGETVGFAKLLADKKTDRLLGAHIIGVRAGDMIAELAVAIEFKASAEDVARSSHAHPTLAEIIKEAALAVDGRALNA
jgi:dihydrolipoamide dehydrogenase